ncbi:ead/Ea22-like family protein [Citrobacter farmeri]|uniref:ead/Ea22-like family protein n=1 Tax=Citrobacter farmeri TaxID=67824 RepID=UPI001905EF61|nr:ead/Ea22-like family protein [Citrobacter farmeri]MBJ9162342.1 ead/Ea22-like family protein [Citrobacter farmeri]
MSNINKQTLAELRKRYTPPEIPKCSICGGELSIQRCGGGEPTVYACDGYEADPENPGMVRRAAGRDIADKHYEESRYIDWKKGGDSDVVALLDELEAAEHTAAVDHEAACSLVEENEELKRRIAELEARGNKPVKGEVLVTISGFTGCGKSAIAGEIEIAMRAIGVPVNWANGDAEKRMTGADCLTAIEMYKPAVRIVEVNVPCAAGIGKGD